MKKPSQPARNRLSAALLSALLVPVAGQALAQDAGEQKATTLDKVVVTGSLIPQSQLETATPVVVISAEDIRARGFVNVSDVLKQSQFATGAVQGSQTSASFTQGAETVSLFGLNPGYTKYLINGRPMADYPALYNGSDTFNNISGVPIDLVERIEILPGGQSSLYGSDAIAGVINIILKQSMDETVVSIRGGTYTEGGGDSGRVSFATGFSGMEERLQVAVGLQYEKSEPIWAYQRDITKQYYQNGTSTPIASRDWLVYSPFTSYNFMDPNNCENLTRAFGGTEGLQERPGFGDGFYCGSFYTPGYRTLKNGKEAFQAYTHVDFEINADHSLYADVLYSNEETKYHIGSNYTWWGTGAEWGYYYDPNLDDLLNLQRAFAPEEMGGFENSMSHDKTDNWSVAFGAKGKLGGNWDYDAYVSSVRQELDEVQFARFNDPINQYFVDNVLGPQQGWDPYYNAYPVFTPDYAAFYTLMSPEDLASFTGFTNSRSKTSDDMLRFQVTNGSLFAMKGGDAGIAIAAEGGRQEWSYRPDARLLNGEIWGTTSTVGGGERNRYAAITELRLPVLEQLTVAASGRYDRFDPDGAESVDDFTWSLGLEFRPVESLLLRGKYGTAFKAPTLADQFQAPSGYYNFVTDYYNCERLGFGPENIDGCPAVYSNRQYFGTTQGSVDLESLTADVWNVGLVWDVLPELNFTVDYFNWDIRDEVGQQDANGLALREMLCRTGASGWDINSPTCQDAISKITRNAAGSITEIFTPKVNEAQQLLEAITASANYSLDMGSAGALLFRASYTNNLKQEYIPFEGDEPIDLLHRPYWSSDPRTKVDASVTWQVNDWSTTLYGNRIGSSPNYRARTIDTYDDPLAERLPGWVRYNLSTTYHALPQLDLSVSINNLLNEMPPEDTSYPGSSGAPYNSSVYDAYGRAVYFEARYTFGD